MNTKTTRVLYWVATLLFVLPQIWSAVQMLIEAPRMTQTITELGYPIYVMKILGVAKLLGAAAILYGCVPLLKEWAYAGFTFDVIGAFCSHVAAGDAFYIALVPLVFFAVQLVSYLLWKRLEGRAVDGVRVPGGRLRPGSA
jgi:hypothetical protein